MIIDASEVVPHRPPALVVAAVETLQEQGGTVSLLPHQGMQTEQLVEAAAQAVAAVNGLLQRRAAAAAGRPYEPSTGFLGALRDIAAHAPMPPGGGAVQVQRLVDLGPLSQWRVVVHNDAGGCCLDGQLTVANGEAPA